MIEYSVILIIPERNLYMKIVVTGSEGMLGRDVVTALKERGHEVVGCDLPEYDITDRIGIQQFIRNEKPGAVIHLAAYTAVDKAENDRAQCFAVNTLGARNIACICNAVGAKLLYTSTDYVFGGEGDEPFETDSPVNPLNHYGKTKADGEEKVRKYCPDSFILRICWTYGKNGKNFVDTMLNLADKQSEIKAVDDQTGSPTYTKALANLICDMIETDKFGTYHASCEGFCTRYEFVREIMRLAGKTVKVLPAESGEFPTPAKRPHNSRLSKKSLDEAGFDRLPDWKTSLAEYLSDK